jgi:hypothetical protein
MTAGDTLKFRNQIILSYTTLFVLTQVNDIFKYIDDTFQLWTPLD